MELLIKAKNLRLEYSSRTILDIDELEIYSYDRIGIVGGNGTGKTTLVKVLSGELVLPGADLQCFGTVTHIPQLDEVAVENIYNSATLSRLGVANINTQSMSGGEETRLKIAASLSKQVHAIFADEPTSHLDQDGINFLIGQLKTFDGAFLLISHDRFFLDSMVDKIWELKDGKIVEYWGGYSQYLDQKQLERQNQAVQYEQMLKEKKRLEQAIEEKHKQAQRMDKKSKIAKKANEGAGRHGKSQGSKQKSLHNAAKNIEQRMETLENTIEPERLRAVKFRQSKAIELHNKFPIVGDNIRLAFADTVLLEGAAFTIPLGAKVALVGGNGTGKTSLFKMIMSKDQSLIISPKAVIGYFEQQGYKFSKEQSVIGFMQEDCDYHLSEIRAVLASMGFGSADINKSLSVLSGGEIIKLHLSKILMGRYNILLMDEPGNYLDLGSIEALEQMMKNYAGTILFITHDNKLVENVADIVYKIEDKKLIKIEDKLALS